MKIKFSFRDITEGRFKKAFEVLVRSDGAVMWLNKKGEVLTENEMLKELDNFKSIYKKDKFIDGHID